MLKRTKRGAAFVGLLVTSALVVLPALAQDAGSSARRGLLSLSLGLEAGRNTDLTPGADDTSAELRGRLAYEHWRRTSIDELHFAAEVNPKLSDDEDTKPLPKVQLDYARSTARSELRFAAVHQRTEVSDQTIGFDEVGSIVYYDGTGERILTRATAKLTGGIDQPLGYTLQASHSDIDYSDDSADRYYASTADRIQLDLRAELAPATGLSFSVAYQDYEADRADELTRTGLRALVGLTHRIDGATRVAFSIGRSRVETERTTGDFTEEGTTFGLLLARDDSRGGYALALDRAITENGARDEVKLTRQTETKLGAFDGMIGVSRGEDEETDVIAALGYTLEMPRDTLKIDLSRAVRTDDEGDDAVVTRVSGKLSHALGDVNSVSFGLSATTTEQETEDTTRVNATVAYTHELGTDADLSAGLRMGLSTRTGREDARSETVFVTLSRRFETLR